VGGCHIAGMHRWLCAFVFAGKLGSANPVTTHFTAAACCAYCIVLPSPHCPDPGLDVHARSLLIRCPLHCCMLGASPTSQLQ